MLISVPVESMQDPILAMIAVINGNSTETVEMQPGVYQIGHFGSSAFPGRGWDSYPCFADITVGDTRECRDPYGVCDSIEQVLALYPELEAPGRGFMVTLTEVRRENQEPGGGWRWHKWGPYIGTYEPKHEYLYDEDIERVFVFRIYERK